MMKGRALWYYLPYFLCRITQVGAGRVAVDVTPSAALNLVPESPILRVLASVVPSYIQL